MTVVSDEPNLVAVTVINGDDLPRLVYRSVRGIAAGEELTVAMPLEIQKIENEFVKGKRAEGKRSTAEGTAVRSRDRPGRSCFVGSTLQRIKRVNDCSNGVKRNYNSTESAVTISSTSSPRSSTSSSSYRDVDSSYRESSTSNEDHTDSSNSDTSSNGCSDSSSSDDDSSDSVRVVVTDNESDIE